MARIKFQSGMYLTRDNRKTWNKEEAQIFSPEKAAAQADYMNRKGQNVEISD